MKFIKYKGKIIAHRGIHNNKDIPENSIKAFKQTLKENIPIELDIQLTKDNIPIIFHDFNTKRMTNKDLFIKDLTLKEVRKLNLLNTKEKIPTLEEVLELVNNKVLLDIEIKNTKKIKLVVTKTLKQLNNYQGQFIIKSFNPRIIKEVRKQNNSVTTGLLITNNYNNIILNKLLPTKLILNIYKPDFIAVNKTIINKKFIQQYNKQVFIWTIKNKSELSDLSKEYIYICNNLPY